MNVRRGPGLPRYEVYKDSGVEWLGEIPAHWAINRLKNLAVINPTLKVEEISLNDTSCFLPMENVATNGDVDYTLKKRTTDLIQGFTSFRQNDVIVAKITPCFENGKGACLDQMPTALGFGSTEFHVLRKRENSNSKFLFYITKSQLFFELGKTLMTGSAGQKRVPSEFLFRFPVALPPLVEQSAIATFLDHKTTKIDQAIAIKEKQIALLKERKQILIQNAVTRGLDPDAPMGDSGVEWIGEIPSHWDIQPIKFSLIGVVDCEHKTAPFVENSDYLVVRTSNVKEGKLQSEEQRS